MLEYRNTPISISEYSPVELLRGRRLSSILPILPSQLKPQAINHQTEKSQLQNGKDKIQKIYNKSSHTQPQLKIGGIIRFQQKDKFWKPGQVQKRLSDRSYNIKSQEGGTFKRNRRHIMKSQENFTNASPAGSTLHSTNTNNCTKTNPLETRQAADEVVGLRSHTNRMLQINKNRQNNTQHQENVTPKQPYVTSSGRISKHRIIKDIYPHPSPRKKKRREA